MGSWYSPTLLYVARLMREADEEASDSRLPEPDVMEERVVREGVRFRGVVLRVRQETRQEGRRGSDSEGSSGSLDVVVGREETASSWTYSG